MIKINNKASNINNPPKMAAPKMAESVSKKRKAPTNINSENQTFKTPKKYTNSLAIEKLFKDYIETGKAKKTINSISPTLIGHRRSNSESMITDVDDQEGWQTPSKTSKARNSDNNKNPDTYNRYDALNPLNSIKNIKTASMAEQLTDSSPGTSQGTEQPDTDANRGQQNSGKPLKPPPIFIIGEDIKETSAKISSAGIKKDAVTIKQNRGSHTILAINRSTYDVIKNKFLELKVQFYTYTPKDLKPQTIVLKHIYGNYSADDIKAEILEANNNINIIKVIPIECKNSVYKKQHFIIQITANSKKKDLTSLKKIGSQVAHWENIVKNKVTQCKNCQRVGHTSSQCNMEYRCVKCSKTHERGKCTITNEDNNKDNLTCANCGEKGHPANFRGCPFLVFANQSRQNHNPPKQKYKQFNTKNTRVNNTPINNNIYNNNNLKNTYNHTNQPRNLDTWPTLPTPRHQPNFGEQRTNNTNQVNNEQINNTPQWAEKMLIGMQKISNQLAGQDRKIDELNNRVNFLYTTLGIEDGDY